MITKHHIMYSRITVYECNLLHLNQIGDRIGHITALNSSIDLPFAINRIFYLYDIPGGESRGAHAHKECHQFLVAASGSFEVLLDDGLEVIGSTVEFLVKTLLVTIVASVGAGPLPN